MLALTLPAVDHDWLAAFAKGFFDLAEEFGVSLIGGDTTRGPLTLTVTIMGEVPAGAALRRSGAKAGNDIWVSGHIGDAALAVAHRHGRLALAEADYREAVMRLYEPTPRVGLGQALRGLATSAIDISDGLLADLGHICRLSKRRRDRRPRRDPAVARSARSTSRTRGGAQRRGRAGGDDYELCFTANPNSRDEHRGPHRHARRAAHAHRPDPKRGKGVSLLGSRRQAGARSMGADSTTSRAA